MNDYQTMSPYQGLGIVPASFPVFSDHSGSENTTPLSSSPRTPSPVRRQYQAILDDDLMCGGASMIVPIRLDCTSKPWPNSQPSSLSAATDTEATNPWTQSMHSTQTATTNSTTAATFSPATTDIAPSSPTSVYSDDDMRMHRKLRLQLIQEHQKQQTQERKQREEKQLQWEDNQLGQFHVWQQQQVSSPRCFQQPVMLTSVRYQLSGQETTPTSQHPQKHESNHQSFPDPGIFATLCYQSPRQKEPMRISRSRWQKLQQEEHTSMYLQQQPQQNETYPIHSERTHQEPILRFSQQQSQQLTLSEQQHISPQQRSPPFQRQPQRHLSHKKKLFGDDGWLGEVPSAETEEHSRQRRSPSQSTLSGFKSFSKKIKERVEDLTTSPDKPESTTRYFFPHRPAVSISLSPAFQRTAYSQLEYLLWQTSADFLNRQNCAGHLPEAAYRQALADWQHGSRRRAPVVGFQFDVATQCSLITAAASELDFEVPETFQVAGQVSGLIQGQFQSQVSVPISPKDKIQCQQLRQQHISTTLHRWRRITDELATRTYCKPDVVVCEHVAVVGEVVKLLGASAETMAAYGLLAETVQREVALNRGN